MNLSPVVAANATIPPVSPSLGTVESAPFSQLLDQAITSAESHQLASQAGVQALLTGETDNLQSVVLGAAKADVSLQILLGVRDRLVSAHQEIMRMQI